MFGRHKTKQELRQIVAKPELSDTAFFPIRNRPLKQSEMVKDYTSGPEFSNPVIDTHNIDPSVPANLGRIHDYPQQRADVYHQRPDIHRTNKP